jgi:hypothetical protein
MVGLVPGLEWCPVCSLDSDHHIQPFEVQKLIAHL